MERYLAKHLSGGSGQQQQQVGSVANNLDARQRFAANSVDSVLQGASGSLISFSNFSQQPSSFQTRVNQYCNGINGVTAMGNRNAMSSYQDPQRLTNTTATARFSGSGTTTNTHASTAQSLLARKALNHCGVSSSHQQTYSSHLRQTPTASVGQKFSSTALQHSSTSHDALIDNLAALMAKPANNSSNTQSSSTCGNNAIINSLATSTVATATAIVNKMDILALVCDAVSATSPSPNQSGGSSVANTSSKSRESPNAVHMFPPHVARTTQIPLDKVRVNESILNFDSEKVSSPTFQPSDMQTKDASATKSCDDYFYEHISKSPNTAGLKEVSVASNSKKPKSKMPSSCSNLAMKSSVSSQASQTPEGLRVGRIRRYSQERKAYGAWEDIYVSNSASDLAYKHIGLKRGGRVRLYTRMLTKEGQTTLSRAMHNCKLYRQYTHSQVFHEPRFHVLLSSKAEHLSTGYMYHGIHMKAKPIDLVPEVASYAKELARIYKLPQDQWDIGVDLIIYRDGDDSIGWHADDTQDESVVLCVVVDAPGEPRPVHIRPNKRAKQLSDGDEEIQLNVGERMGYDMDGLMQHGYEHSLPKKRDSASHRFVLIFRHGKTTPVHKDSGRAICKSGMEHENLMSLISRVRVKPPLVSFGHTQGVFEGMVYSRRSLYSNNAHRADQRGISGNLNAGADSIVVSRQCPEKREEDGLSWLRYTSSRAQGGGALCVSHRKRFPVRVFRSSNLTSEYAPLELDGGRTSYRYDGLYIVTRIWNEDGNSLDGDDIMVPTGGYQYTFNLVRLPHDKTTSVGPSPSTECNTMSIDQLWNTIQTSHGRQPSQFLPACPQSIGTLPKLANDAVMRKKARDVTESVSRQRKDNGKMLQPAEVTAVSPITLTVQAAPQNRIESFIQRESVVGGQRMVQNPDRFDTLPAPLVDSFSAAMMLGQMSRASLHQQLQVLPYSLRQMHQPCYSRRTWPFPRAGQCLQLNSLGQLTQILRNGLETPPNDTSNVPVIISHTSNKTSHSGQPHSTLVTATKQSEPSTKRAASDKITESERERLELECDFTSSKAIKHTFRYQKGMGKLTPLLQEIAMRETSAEKADYVRSWRWLTKEQQEQIKKEVNAPLLARRQEEKRQKEQRRKEVQRKAAMKVKIARGGQQELDIFAHSVILTEDWRRTGVGLTGGGIHELQQFALNSCNTIYLQTMERHGLKKEVKSKKRCAAQVANKWQSNKPKRQRLQPSKHLGVAEPSRKITPKFITLEDNTQSLSPSLEAKCKDGRRKSKEVRVTVKWSLTADKESKEDDVVEMPTNQEEQTPAFDDEQASGGRKRNIPEMEQSPVELDGQPRRKSQRLTNKVETFAKKEKVFAWDRGHLYEAQVMKCRDIKGVAEYYVHFMGYNKSHERWLASRDMKKITPESQEFFGEYKSRSLPKGGDTGDVAKKLANDKHSRDSRHKEPQVGMRVGVQFTETDKYYGGYYYGKVIKVSRVSRQKQNKFTHCIKLKYDDGEEEEEFYPDANITLDPMEDPLRVKGKRTSKASGVDASVRGKQSRKKQIEYMKKAPKSPKRKSPRALEKSKDSMKAKTKSEAQVNSTEKMKEAVCSTRSAQADENHKQEPQVGMRVGVQFKETDEFHGGYYCGEITKVSRVSKKKKNLTHHITIKYDDGDEEETVYPDPDITLDPIDSLRSKDKACENNEQEDAIDVGASVSVKKKQTSETQAAPIKRTPKSPTRKSPRLLSDKPGESNIATKQVQSAIKAKSSLESHPRSRKSTSVPVAGMRVSPRRAVQNINYLTHSKKTDAKPASPASSMRSSSSKSGSDIILSLTNERYKQVMFAAYRELGVRNGGEIERIADKKQEIISLFKREMGQDGRFLKTDRKMKTTREVDEKEAMLKIRMDLVRRNENKNHWLSND